MKQKIVMSLIMLLMSCYGSPLSAESRVDWGMKISFDAELPGKWKGENASVTMFSPGIGVTLGGVCDIGMGKNFFFEPGVSLFYSGYKYKDLYIQGPEGEMIEKDPKVTKYGIQVPLLVGYSFDISDKFGLDVFTGPQLRYAFAGKTHIKDKNIQDDLGGNFDLFNIQHRFDCSWKIGIGLPLKNNCVLSLEGDIGITDLLKEDMSFRENRLALGFTKFF